MLKHDLHVHTLKSGHAFNTLFELTKVAVEKGIDTLGITDHGPSMQGAPHLGYFEMVKQIPNKLFGINIIFGCEANIVNLDGEIDIPDELQKDLGLIFIGLHKRTAFPAETSVEQNTQSIVQAISKNRVHAISHPWRQEFPVNIETIFEAAIEYNVLLELNLRALNVFVKTGQGLAEIHKMVDLVQKAKTKIIISSDAHIAIELGDDSILEQLELNIPPEIVLGRSNGNEEIMNFLKEK